MSSDVIASALPSVLTVIVAVCSWGVVHFLSIRRDRNNKKREIKVQHLIQAYRSIEHASNRNLSEKSASAIESAIADIQLFGSKEQVCLALDFARNFSSTKSASLDSLLDNLRTELRQELDLEKIEGHPMILRLHVK